MLDLYKNRVGRQTIIIVPSLRSLGKFETPLILFAHACSWWRGAKIRELHFDHQLYTLIISRKPRPVQSSSPNPTKTAQTEATTETQDIIIADAPYQPHVPSPARESSSSNPPPSPASAHADTQRSRPLQQHPIPEP